MSEIVATTVADCTKETEQQQMIDDLQNIGNVDKAAKLAALLGNDTDVSSAAKEEVGNDVSENGDKPEVKHNGTTQNGDAITNSEDASSDAEKSNLTTTTSVETPCESSGTGTVTEDGSEKCNEMRPEEPCGTETSPTKSVSESHATVQQDEDCKTKSPCSASSSECQSESKISPSCEGKMSCGDESNKCRTKDGSTGEQRECEQVSVTKQMGDLNVESEGAKGPSPSKKSCSPF